MTRARCLAALLAAALLLATPGAAFAGSAAQGGRPSLPAEQTLGTEHFVVRYTTTGQHSVPVVDADRSGVPDYVEAVADALEYNWTVQIEQMGWPAPPDDRGEGGDERIDVYLEEVLAGGEAGYVETNGFVGDNPNTPGQERRAAYGYMVLDDDYEELDPASSGSPDGLMRATVAHEFNHLLQAGLDNQDVHAWYYEATASWMEDALHDEVNDVVFYLDSVMKNPDICPVAFEARGDSAHWYGMWIFNQFLSERYGPEVVRDIWLAMPELNAYRAMDEVLAARGTTLEAAFRDMAVANLLRAYEEGSTYPTVRVEGEIGIGVYRPPDGVQGLGADYVALAAAEPVEVSLVESGGMLGLSAVGVRGGEAAVIRAAGGLTLDPAAYDAVYLVIHNDERAVVENECRFADYAISVAPATGEPTAPTATLPAPAYVSPLGEAVALTEGGQNTYRPPDEPFMQDSDAYVTAPEALDVPFDVLVPASPPPGYTFDYAYVLTQADLGTDAPYYAPGGGDMANLDYLDEPGNWLSIGESVSPYATLEEWLADIGYDSPGEIVTVDGHPVLLEDLSQPDGTWYSATLILDGLFIVADGDRSAADTLVLVEGLIAAARAEPESQATPSEPAATAPPPTLPQPSLALPELGGIAMAGLGLLCGALLCVSGVAVLGVVLLLRRR